MIYEKENFKLIDHERPVISYKHTSGELVGYRLSAKLFNNFARKQKNKTSTTADKEDSEEASKIKSFLQDCKLKNLFKNYSNDIADKLKSDNNDLMNEFYKLSCDFKEFHGENNFEHGVVTTINNSSYLIPARCRFFNKNVSEIEKLLGHSEKFDFIVIDPPWKCRYIRRLKKTCSEKSYKMMTNEEISRLPIQKYAHKSTIVAIWCTNSETHENFIKEHMLREWDLKLTTFWQWIKVDKTGEMFCSFDSSRGSKKPYEKLFIAVNTENENLEKLIPKEISIVSQPSSIHSHKPPLLELFRHILPEKPKCLEIFARSLYENFTSIGTEVLKLQSTLLFDLIPPT